MCKFNNDQWWSVYFSQNLSKKVFLQLIHTVSENEDGTVTEKETCFVDFYCIWKRIQKQMLHHLKILIYLEILKSRKKSGMASFWGGQQPLDWKSKTFF